MRALKIIYEGRSKAKSNLSKNTRRKQNTSKGYPNNTLPNVTRAKLVGTQKQLHEHPVHPVWKQKLNNNITITISVSESLSQYLSQSLLFSILTHCIDNRRIRNVVQVAQPSV